MVRLTYFLQGKIYFNSFRLVDNCCVPDTHHLDLKKPLSEGVNMAAAQGAANARIEEIYDHVDTVASVNANLRNETKNLLENGFDISKSKICCILQK